MNEQELRSLIEGVRRGAVTRRSFVRTLLQFGIAAPMAGQILLQAGVAPAATVFNYKPTKRGGGGALKTLWWTGATTLNPYFAIGSRDTDAARIFYEPLASWDSEANLIPVLAAEIPTRQNGGVAPDGLSVTWKLKRGVRWHDGKPFTSADLVFNWEYASDPATASVAIGSFEGVMVRALDELTVRVEFAQPRAFWAECFVGGTGVGIIPKHLFEPYKGAKSREAPNNLKPVGTGPYKFVSFTPADMVRGQINTDYHQPNRPYFDTIEIKGGGDAVSAARAVLQTGEYDYAWYLAVEDDILTRLETGGKGRVELAWGGYVTFMELNFSDPWTEVEGERSNSKTKHPLLSDPAVREALNLLVDRASIQKVIYGRAGIATANIVHNPQRFRSTNNRFEFDIEKAVQVLDRAGWKLAADGVRAKEGKRLKLVFQTSANQVRQKMQAIVKQACQKAGIEMELKAVDGSVFFSQDLSNPDTAMKFYCDLQMYTNDSGADPGPGLRRFCSSEIPSKANKWQRSNAGRWSNEEYDRLYRSAEVEIDPVKRAAMLIRLSELPIQDRAVIPIVAAASVHAANSKLRLPVSGWDSDFWAVQDWYREA